MRFVFFETPLFTRLLPRYLDDEGYQALQRALLARPEQGPVIAGTGGFRKLRWWDQRRDRGSDGGPMSTTEKRNPRRASGAKGKRVKKRPLFKELMDGVDAMRRERQGKITLRTHEVTEQPPLTVEARVIRETRERLHVSRAVFARRLRVATRTLENWEQGRARPNAQAAALILMVRKYPDTLEKLQTLEV
jgi:putative transcriptional regulator